jgi:hypothetical protein
MSTTVGKETHRRVLEMVAQGHSHRTIAKELGIGVGTVSELRHRPIEVTPDSQAQTDEICGDKWSISLPKTRIHTLEQLVEYCKIDLFVWEVERFVVNKWEVAAKITTFGTETMEVEPLFQVKAFLRKKKAVVSAKAEIDALMELAKKSARLPDTINRIKKITGNMLEINIPDAHFGKLAWAIETGGENYDVKIARKTFVAALTGLLQRVSQYAFDEILFVVGNDLLNSDDIEGRTTKGTNVSNDGRYHKTFATVRNLMIECIERLRTFAPVKVVMVAGNHDALSVWHLGDSLECYFHNYEDVTIDNSPRYRKYHQFGNVMIMFTHGDKGKKNDYPLLMATEKPEMFGSTKFREAHTGHTHQTKLDEQHGVRVRVLPALCAADDWHSENGYVGNLRNAEAYIWNKAEGLIGTAIFNADSNPVKED